MCMNDSCLHVKEGMRWCVCVNHRWVGACVSERMNIKQSCAALCLVCDSICGTEVSDLSHAAGLSSRSAEKQHNVT